MECKEGERQPPPFQDILFTLVRVCWHNHPRGHSMDPPPSPPLPLFSLYIYTRSKISFPSGFRTQLLLSSTHYKHPERVSLSPTISSNVTLPQYRSWFVTYSPPCTRESQRGLEPSKLGDMSLELEEFDLRGFEETEGDRMGEEE